MTSGWTSFFTENLGLKLVALLLAVAVYAHVQTEKLQEARVAAPLAVRGLGENLVLLNPPPERVLLTLRAKGKQLIKMRMRPPEVVVDLSDVRPGEVQRMLSAGDVLLPLDADITVAGIQEPRMITFEVDSLEQRTVPVEVPLLGDLSDRLTWRGTLRAIPPRVTIRGPATRLAGIQLVGTEPLDLAGITASASRRLALETPGAGLSVEPESVRVDIPVTAVESRLLGPLPVRVTGVRRGWTCTVDPDSVRVLVVGTSPRLDELDLRHIDLLLDVRGFTEGRFDARPEVRLFVDSLEVREIEPPEVSFRLAPAGR